MTIKQYENLLVLNNADVSNVLDKTLAKIKFLENIYMIDGKNHHYSKDFNDLAIKERNEFCKLSSACYNLIRSEELKKNKKI